MASKTNILSEETINNIKKDSENGLSRRLIAKKYGISEYYVKSILGPYIQLKDRLSDNDKKTIRELNKNGVSLRRLARKYSTNTDIISQVLKNKI